MHISREFRKHIKTIDITVKLLSPSFKCFTVKATSQSFRSHVPTSTLTSLSFALVRTDTHRSQWLWQQWSLSGTCVSAHAPVHRKGSSGGRKGSFWANEDVCRRWKMEMWRLKKHLFYVSADTKSSKVNTKDKLTVLLVYIYWQTPFSTSVFNWL